MKKISKKNLRLNKEVVASLSENEMQKVVGGDVTGKDTANESICICALSKVPKDCFGYTHVCAESQLADCTKRCMVSTNCDLSADCHAILSENECNCYKPTIEIIHTNQTC